MPSAELFCPHCGSMLNLGSEIAPGSRVECLICMRSFVAEPGTQPEKLATRPPEVPKAGLGQRIPTATLAPAPEPLRSKKQVENDSAIDVPARNAMQVLPGGCCAGKRVALVLAGTGMLVLILAGVGFMMWKKSPASTEMPMVESSSTPASTLVENLAPPAPPEPKSPPTSPAIEPNKLDASALPTTPPTSSDEESPAQKKVQTLKSLVRTNLSTPAEAEVPAPEPVSIPVVQKLSGVGVTHEKVQSAIDRGLGFLKKTQSNRAWPTEHPVGIAALGGLTLLECNVPASDPSVMQVATFLRNQSPTVFETYELSLAILFLDRLGDPRDRGRIQGMALRLLAGQNESGGWTYNCPVLDPGDMLQLYTFLQSNQPPRLHNPIAMKGELPAGVAKDALDPTSPLAGKTSDPFVKLQQMIRAQDTRSSPGPDSKKPVYEESKLNGDEGKTDSPKAKPGRASATRPPMRPDLLKQNLRMIPVVQQQGKQKNQMRVRQAEGDNSNTQFAMLALWAARRHDLPTDQALLLSSHRFVASQNPDGGWAYMPGMPMSRPTMTCVGLLGLAMGHGVAPDPLEVDGGKNQPNVAPALLDPQIQKGLKVLAKNIGDPHPVGKRFPMENLYLLWSIERVAVLYDLKLIEDRDWYSWGAQVLVHNQNGDGCWNNFNSPNAHYHGACNHVNTCFALLFLKRSNLVQDLTNNLRLQTGITNPAPR